MTKKEIQAQVEKYITDLGIDLAEAKNDLKSARATKTQLETILTTSEALVAQLQDTDTGVGAKLAEGDVSLQKIKIVNDTTQTHLDAITANITNIQQKITDMEATYTSFQALKLRIDDPSTGLQALLTTATTLKDQAQAIATKASSSQTEIETSVARINVLLAEMDATYITFQVTKKKIEDPSTGLEMVLDETQNLHDKIAATEKTSQTLHAQISNYKDEAAKNIAAIGKVKSEADASLSQIKETETESEATKGRIAEIYDLVSQTGHANRFDRRAKSLRNSSWIWFAIGASSIIAAVIVATNLIVPQLDKFHPDATQVQTQLVISLVLRSVIVTPLLVFGVFTLNNFIKDRRLSEQYAFKAVSAATIEGTISLIKRSVNDVPDDQLANFAIQSATNLHTEPTELQTRSKVTLKANSKLINLGAEITDTLDSIDKNIGSVKDGLVTQTQ